MLRGHTCRGPIGQNCLGGFAHHTSAEPHECPRCSARNGESDMSTGPTTDYRSKPARRAHCLSAQRAKVAAACPHNDYSRPVAAKSSVEPKCKIMLGKPRNRPTHIALNKVADGASNGGIHLKHDQQHIGHYINKGTVCSSLHIKRLPSLRDCPIEAHKLPDVARQNGTEQSAPSLQDLQGYVVHVSGIGASEGKEVPHLRLRSQ